MILAQTQGVALTAALSHRSTQSTPPAIGPPRPATPSSLLRAHLALLTTAMEIYNVALLTNPKAQVKRAHVEFLQRFPCVYLVSHPDDAEGQMWRECKAALGDRLRTVLVPEGMKDVGDLAEQATAPARIFGRLENAAK